MSEPFAGMEPFLNFSIGLGMFHPCNDRSDISCFKVLPEFTIPIPILVPSMSTRFTAIIHNKFTKRADLPVFLDCTFSNDNCVFRIDSGRFTGSEDFT